jgi:hypothetical protein
MAIGAALSRVFSIVATLLWLVAPPDLQPFVARSVRSAPIRPGQIWSGPSGSGDKQAAEGVLDDLIAADAELD